jgi:hypothetical protein
VGNSVEVESSTTLDHSVIYPSSVESKNLSSTSFFSSLPNSLTGANLPHLENLEASHESRRAETKPLDDVTDIEAIIHLDSSKIPVKTLRVVVPRMRVICYSKEEEICGKKKCMSNSVNVLSDIVSFSSFSVKNLWSERPHDWPLDVPFQDPNNKGPSIFTWVPLNAT